MAATGNEAVKLSQLKSLNDKTVEKYTAAVAAEASERQKQDGLLQTSIDAKLQADDLVAGTNVTLDTSSQPGKVVVSASGGNSYITSVEPVNMKVTGGKLSFTDGSEFFTPAGGGMFGYELAQNCLPVRTLANGDEQIACIVLNSRQFKAVDGNPTYQEQPLLKLNAVLDFSTLQDFYVSISQNQDDPVQTETPITAGSLKMFPTLPSQDTGSDYRPDYGTAGAVLSSNGDRTFSWKQLDGGGGAIDPGSITTTELADNAVTTAKIADSAVTSNKIAMHAVDTQQLAVGAVTANILALGAVTGKNIALTIIESYNISIVIMVEIPPVDIEHIAIGTKNYAYLPLPAIIGGDNIFYPFFNW